MMGPLALNTNCPAKDGTSSVANSIYAYSDDAYICGYDFYGGNNHACYWINNNQKIIEDTLGSGCNSIFIKTNNED